MNIINSLNQLLFHRPANSKVTTQLTTLVKNSKNPIFSANNLSNHFFQADGQIRPGFSVDPNGDYNFNPHGPGNGFSQGWATTRYIPTSSPNSVMKNIPTPLIPSGNSFRI